MFRVLYNVNMSRLNRQTKLTKPFIYSLAGNEGFFPRTDQPLESLTDGQLWIYETPQQLHVFRQSPLVPRH